MIFEEQTYQLACVNAIMLALDNTDLDSPDAHKQITQNLKDTPPCEYTNRFPLRNQNRIDIMMETGTGKTFTYINAIFALNEQFEKNRFIIVLPRSAIKYGVIQQIHLTRDYFYRKFKRYLNVISYPEDGIQQVENQFLRNEDLSVLVTTNSAFNSEANVINQPVEFEFEERTVWESISKTAPVVIIDEPHLLKGSETQRGLNQLSRSTQIRFGATFPTHEEYQLSNVAYVLDSISAFNGHLVKRIAVSTIFQSPEISTERIHSVEPRVRFALSYNINEQLNTCWLKVGDDVGARSGIPNLKGVSVVRINKSNVRLSNGTTWDCSSDHYDLDEDEISMLIRTTIQTHFRKELELFNKGIKALALFFIPSISDFRGESPRIKEIFERVYREERTKIMRKVLPTSYRAYLKQDFSSSGDLLIHEGYFAGDRGTLEEKERTGVELILKDKERLLSFDTPLRFIFSVWALQEGWDNPNVMTLCKLRSTGSEISKRQQVGRGLRLCFDRIGRRHTFTYYENDENQFFNSNTLDVIVSGKEQEFIQHIQTEIKNASFTISGRKISLSDFIDLGLTDVEAAQIYVIFQSHGVIQEDGTVTQPLGEWLSDNRGLFAQIDEERFNEISQVLHHSGTETVIDNNVERPIVRLREEKWREFMPLWKNINLKVTISSGQIDMDDVVEQTSLTFNTRDISEKNVVIRSQVYQSEDDIIKVTSQRRLNAVRYFESGSLDRFIMYFAQHNSLPISFCLKLFGAIEIEKFKNDPYESQHLLESDLKSYLNIAAVKAIRYRIFNDLRLPNPMQNEQGQPITQYDYGVFGRFILDKTPPPQYLFDKVAYDAKIEMTSILDDAASEGNKHIRVFAKLPRIRIPIPFGSYSPDFAYLITRERKKPLLLVIETKGYDDESKISSEEMLKIQYASRFFDSLRRKIPDMVIAFRTRVNRNSLWELISEY